MNKQTLDWFEHWINNLISKETILKYEFHEWIKGFESRYSSTELYFMNIFWWYRRNFLIIEEEIR